MTDEEKELCQAKFNLSGYDTTGWKYTGCSLNGNRKSLHFTGIDQRIGQAATIVLLQNPDVPLADIHLEVTDNEEGISA